MPPTCQLCSSRPASYVCHSCGRAICSGCFDPFNWLCFNCKGGVKEPVEAQVEAWHFPAATWLFVIAFITITVGFMLLMLSPILNGTVSGGGGFILIGPFPIIIGTANYSGVLVALAVALTVLAIAFYILMWRRR